MRFTISNCNLLKYFSLTLDLHNFKSLSGERYTSDPANFAPVGKKRPLEEDCCEMMDSTEVKRPCPPTAPTTAPSDSRSLEKILNFPLPSSDSVGCIVKMYRDEELPLNEIFEVLGIVSFNTPGVSADNDEHEDFHPPSSVIPRIHCIIAHKLLHNNPHLSRHAGPKWEEGK